MKDVTDVALSIRTSDEEISNWNRTRIVEALKRETNVDSTLADRISLDVEKQVLSSNIKTITTSLVRELVNAKLIELGLEKERLKHDRLGVPLYDVENLIMSRNKENSNVPHGPEATNLTLAEIIKKEFALRKVFSKDVGEAHLRGDIHLHDLGFVDRVYSFTREMVVFIRIKSGGIQLITLGDLFNLADYTYRDSGFEIGFISDCEIYDKNGWTSLKRVVRHQREGKDLLLIKTVGGKIVIPTEDHPMIVKNQSDLLAARDLKIEDTLEVLNLNNQLEAEIQTAKELRRYERCSLFSNENFLELQGSGSVIDLSEADLNSKRIYYFDNVLVEGHLVSNLSQEEVKLLRQKGYDVLITEDTLIRNSGRDGRIHCDSRAFPALLRLTEEFCYMLGIFIAEGSYDTNTLSIWSSNNSTLIRCQDALNSCGFPARIQTSDESREGGVHSYCALLSDIFLFHFKLGKGFRFIGLPVQVLQWEAKFVFAILSGLIDGDGCNIGIDKTLRASISTASIKKASQVQLVLAAYGIKASLGFEKSHGQVRIYNGNAVIQNYDIFHVAFGIINQSLFSQSYKVSNSKKDSCNRYLIDTGEVTKISDVSYLDDEHVYDVTTSSSTFYCNGILMHNCSGQSLEYVKKYGLNLPNAMAIAKPANRAEVLLAHMVKFAAALQCHFAGAIGWDAVNIFFAPYLVNKTEKEIKQLAQMLVFEFSQQAVARGGQSIFSLVPNEYVWIKQGDKLSLRKIGDVVDGVLSIGGSTQAPTHEFTTENRENLEVLSFDSLGRSTFEPISAFIRLPYKGKMYRIRTQHGLLEGVSSEHSVFVFNGEKVVPKRVESLQPNDYIIIPRKVELSEKLKNFNIAEYYLSRDDGDDFIRVKHGKGFFVQALKCKFGRYFYSEFSKVENIPISRVTSNWFRTDKIPLKIYYKYVGSFENVNLCIKGDSQYEIRPTIEISDELVRILGYYISEGTKNTRSGISVCNLDPDLLEDANQCFLSMAANSSVRKVKENGLSNVYCNGIFAKLILDLCENQKEKIIPHILFNLPKRQKELFLLSFWKGDGIKNPTNSNVQMAFCNTSREVISGIALLSASLGKEFRIYLTTYKSRSEEWKLQHEGCENWKDLYTLTWVNDKVRIIDHGLDIYYVPGTCHKIRKRLIHFLEDLKLLDIERFHPLTSNVRQLIDSDLGFSRIHEITPYDYEGYIYDFSVKSTESFAGGTGLIFFHNTDCNIYWEIPKHFENTPAIGPGGEYTGKTYKDYEKESQQFAWSLLDVYKEGDGCGRPFFFPKILIHMTEKFFQTPKHIEFLTHTCKVASKMGSPYFVFDRGATAKISECCRLSFKLTQKDLEDAQYPWKMRYCAFQNVTLNLPRVGYTCKGDKVFDKITKLLNLAIKAHLQKQRFIKKIFNLGSEGPLALLAMKNDGDTYLKMEKASYLIGMVGLNELVKIQCGCEMHQSDEAFKYGLSIIAHMKLLTDKAKEEYKMHFVLEQSPAEATSHRFARLDLKYYPEKANEIVLGDLSTDSVYYTNSTQLNSGVMVDPITRVQKEGLFHPLIEAGSISNLFIGEHEPSAESLANFIIKVFKFTKNDQITFSPEFTSCLECFKTSRGLLEACPYCGSKNVEGITRITGYFSKISGWNKGKLSELADRVRVII